MSHDRSTAQLDVFNVLSKLQSSLPPSQFDVSASTVLIQRPVRLLFQFDVINVVTRRLTATM